MEDTGPDFDVDRTVLTTDICDDSTGTSQEDSGNEEPVDVAPEGARPESRV